MRAVALVVLVVVAVSALQKDVPSRADRLSDTCEDCQGLVGRFIAASQDSYKREQLQAALRVVCGHTPYVNECKVLVKNIERVVLRLQPYMKNHRAVCRKLKMCDSGEIGDFARLILLAGKQHLNRIDGQADNVCSECQLAANGIAKTIGNKARQGDLHKYVRRTVCKHLGRHRDACVAAADELLPAFFVDLQAIFADTSKACDQMGMCNAIGMPETKLRRPSKSLSTLAKHFWEKQPRDAAGNGLACLECKVFFDVLLDDLATDKSTKNLGKDLRDLACPMLPESFLAGCDDFLNLYAPTVVYMTVKQTDSAGVCTAMHKCDPEMIRKLNALPQKELNGMACEACKQSSKYAQEQLSNPEFTSDIVTALENYVCDAFPGTYKPLCENMVNRFVPRMVQSAAAALGDPEVCSTKLHLC